MLDDGHFLASIDKGNALGIVGGQPAQLRQSFGVKLPKWHGIQNLVMAGMGGSAMAGEFIRAWLSDRLELPFMIIRDYKLPAFIGPGSLVIISSYSGNTEETVSAFRQAREQKAKILVVCSGGELEKLAQKHKLPLILLPAGLQPRMATWYEVRALTMALESLGLFRGISQELEKAADWVEPMTEAWTAESPTVHNHAKRLAEKLFGFAVVVYSGSVLTSVGQKWKINFNENAKNLAFYSPWPEFNHNEMQGWGNPQQKPLRVVELRSPMDHPHLAKRYEVTARLLSGKMPPPIVVEAEGMTRLQQMLWTQLLGDFASIYLAILNRADPLDIAMIEKLKKELT